MSTKKPTPKKDINDLFNDKKVDEWDKPLQYLFFALEKYNEQREVKTAQDRVDVVCMVAAAMEWTEEEFDDVIDRFHAIKVQRDTGLTPKQIRKLIEGAEVKLKDEKNGPVH